ncbi:MAG: glycosyltransferase [Eubacteriales bacterium]|nr:glycosyltransferase [Lachnospiraceae bacterium]MDO5127027.1 glycosyltransferase [Eubacteriales bacterium]
MDSQTVAIIMTAYNEECDWIVQCMDSILAQTYTNFHLYVLLDNPDNEMIKDVLMSYAKKDSRMAVMVNEENLGLVASLNKLLGIVNESYIARMDADDVMMPSRLAKEMEFMRENSLDFVMSNCDFLYADGTSGKGASIPKLLGEDFNDAERYGNVSMHNTWLVKKEVYDKLGGYRMVRHCEDYDFVLRAIQEGYKIGRLDEALVSYRLRDTSVSAMYAKEQFEKARMLRYLYNKGRKIADISPEKFNEKYSAYTEEEKKAFSDAKNAIDIFCGKLYDGKMPAAAASAAKMLISGREARKLFVNAMWNNRKLKTVYRKAEDK